MVVTGAAERWVFPTRAVTLDRSAALVLRVWTEDDEAFRARLTLAPLTGDQAVGEEATVAVAATPRDVIEAVRAWLNDFVAGVDTAD